MLYTALVATILHASRPSAGIGEQVSLKWQVQRGQVRQYKVTLDGKRGGVAFQTESVFQQTILTVEKDGRFTLKSESKGMLLRSEGQEMRDDQPHSVIGNFAADGHLLAYTDAEDPKESARSAAFNRFIAPEKPVAAGDKWTFGYPAGNKLGIPESRTDYTVLSVSPQDVTVTADYRELVGAKPRSGSATWVIDRKDGTPVKFESKLQNLAEGVTDVQVKMALVR